MAVSRYGGCRFCFKPPLDHLFRTILGKKNIEVPKCLYVLPVVLNDELESLDRYKFSLERLLVRAVLKH